MWLRGFKKRNDFVFQRHKPNIFSQLLKRENSIMKQKIRKNKWGKYTVKYFLVFKREKIFLCYKFMPRKVASLPKNPLQNFIDFLINLEPSAQTTKDKNVKCQMDVCFYIDLCDPVVNRPPTTDHWPLTDGIVCQLCSWPWKTLTCRQRMNEKSEANLWETAHINLTFLSIICVFFCVSYVETIIRVGWNENSSRFFRNLLQTLAF